MAPNPSESALMASLQARLFHWKTFSTVANTQLEHIWRYCNRFSCTCQAVPSMITFFLINHRNNWLACHLHLQWTNLSNAKSWHSATDRPKQHPPVRLILLHPGSRSWQLCLAPQPLDLGPHFPELVLQHLYNPSTLGGAKKPKYKSLKSTLQFMVAFCFLITKI